MRANELRIGSLVIKSGKEHRVFPMDISNLQQANQTGFSSGYEPIPLTYEWLLKFGFEKWLLDSKETCSYYRLGVINLMKSDSLSYGCSFEPENDHSWFTEIQHVHQLQNLYFALTGQELTIKTTNG